MVRRINRCPERRARTLFRPPPPLRTPKWVKSDVRRGRRQPPPSNLSPAARCHVLSVIRGDGLYTQPRRPGRARITTRAHNTLSLSHTHTHINVYNTYIYILYQTWSVGCWGSWDVFDFFSVLVPLSSRSPIPIADSNFFALPNPRQSHCGRFIPSRYTCLCFEIAYVLLSAISRSTRPQRQRGTVSIYTHGSHLHIIIYIRKKT